MRYRTWLKNEIYSQLRVLNADASFNDAKLFVYMVEGTIIQLLSSDGAIEREKMLDYFLNSFVRNFSPCMFTHVDASKC